VLQREREGERVCVCVRVSVHLDPCSRLYLMKCAATCHSFEQCRAVCCSVLQCVAVGP